VDRLSIHLKKNHSVLHTDEYIKDQKKRKLYFYWKGNNEFPSFVSPEEIQRAHEWWALRRPQNTLPIEIETESTTAETTQPEETLHGQNNPECVIIVSGIGPENIYMPEAPNIDHLLEMFRENVPEQNQLVSHLTTPMDIDGIVEPSTERPCSMMPSQENLDSAALLEENLALKKKITDDKKRLELTETFYKGKIKEIISKAEFAKKFYREKCAEAIVETSKHQNLYEEVKAGSSQLQCLYDQKADELTQLTDDKKELQLQLEKKEEELGQAQDEKKKLEHQLQEKEDELGQALNEKKKLERQLLVVKKKYETQKAINMVDQQVEEAKCVFEQGLDKEKKKNETLVKRLNKELEDAGLTSDYWNQLIKSPDEPSNCYISEDFIDLYMKNLCESSPNCKNILSQEFQFYIDSHTYNHKKEAAEALRHLRKEIKGLLRKKDQIIFIPFLQSKHWFLLTVMVDQNLIIVSDSMKSMAEDCINTIKEFVLKLFPGFELKIDEFAPQQEQKTNDCGAWTCLYARHYKRNKKMYSAKSIFKNVSPRKEIAIQLANKYLMSMDQL